jgi:hypothetical protein
MPDTIGNIQVYLTPAGQAGQAERAHLELEARIADALAEASAPVRPDPPWPALKQVRRCRALRAIGSDTHALAGPSHGSAVMKERISLSRSASFDRKT